MKKLIVAAIILSALSLVTFAAAPPAPSRKVSIKPLINDPQDTGIVVAAWLTKSGLPDAGKSNHALYLQKDGPTATDASAIGDIRWLENRNISGLTELGFDYRNGEHCTAVAPRFVIQVDGVNYSLGCASGVPSAAPEDPLKWTRVRFGLAEFAAAGIPLTGKITSSMIVFDEGTDAGPGFVHMDNIDINGTLIGKPGNSKPPLAF